MKLPKIVKIIFSLLIAVSGWLMVGVGYSTPLEGQLNTIFFLMGLPVFLVGVYGLFSTLLYEGKVAESVVQNGLSIEQQKFGLYLTVLRFLVFKVTDNLRRIYLDFELDSKKIILTAFYRNEPTEEELELLDDIVTNSNAHIPDFFVDANTKLIKNLTPSEKHELIVFAAHD
jgi:hypothetical protein